MNIVPLSQPFKKAELAETLRNLLTAADRTSPRMQEFVTLLARQHRYDLNLYNPRIPQTPLHLKLREQSRFEIPLVIKRRGANLVSVARWFRLTPQEQHGK